MEPFRSRVFFIAVITALYSSTSSSDIASHPNLHLLPEDCGKIKVSHGYETMQISGQPGNATLGQVPWIALLGYRDNGKIKYKCYGALINQNYIVTTTECAIDCTFGVPVIARFGEVNITTEKGCKEEDCAPNPEDIEIESIQVNAKFRKNWKNNIALLRLKTPVTINEYVSAVCLPLGTEATGDLFEETVFVTGWEEKSNVRRYPYPIAYSDSFQAAGKYGGGAPEEQVIAEAVNVTTVTTARPCRRCNRLRGLGYLQYYADLVIEAAECRAQFAQGVECSDCQYATEGTICTEADPYGEKKNTCQRQHGSPVTYRSNSTNSFYLVGIVLQSESYCQFAAPVLSTKVSHHLQFILDGIKP